MVSKYRARQMFSHLRTRDDDDDDDIIRDTVGIVRFPAPRKQGISPFASARFVISNKGIG